MVIKFIQNSLFLTIFALKSFENTVEMSNATYSSLFDIPATTTTLFLINELGEIGIRFTHHYVVLWVLPTMLLLSFTCMLSQLPLMFQLHLFFEFPLSSLLRVLEE